MACRLLHAADLHLGRAHAWLGERAEERRAEADRLLKRLADFALAARPPFAALLLAGDVFDDPWPAEELAGQALGELRRLAAAGVLPVVVPGNHDELSYPDGVFRRRRADWPGVLVTNPLPALVHTLRAGGETVHLHASAFVEGESPARLPPYVRGAEPGVHLGLFHAALEEGGGDRAPVAPPAWLARSGLDYVALGHAHRPRRVVLEGGASAAYPGAIEGGGFADPGGGAPLAVIVADGRVAAVEETPFSARRIATREVDLAGLRDAEALRQLVQGLADPELILRLRLQGVAGFEPEAALLRGENAARFWHLEVQDEARLAQAAQAGELAAQDTVLGLFTRKLQRALEAAQDPAERRLLELAFRKGLEAFRP